MALFSTRPITLIARLLPAQSHTLGSIPRPTRRRQFASVLHIHEALTRNTSGYSDLILTDEDFGEFYLRRRLVPDPIYNATLLFHLILVGYGRLQKTTIPSVHF